MSERATATAPFYLCVLRDWLEFIGQCDKWVLGTWIGFDINPAAAYYRKRIIDSAKQSALNDFENCESGRYPSPPDDEPSMRVAISTRLKGAGGKNGSERALQSSMLVNFGHTCGKVPWQVFAVAQQELTLYSPESMINGKRNYRVHLYRTEFLPPDSRLGAYVRAGERAPYIPYLTILAEAIVGADYSIHPIEVMPEDFDPARIETPMPTHLSGRIDTEAGGKIRIFHALEYHSPTGEVITTGIVYDEIDIEEENGFIQIQNQEATFSVFINLYWALYYSVPDGVRGGDNRVRYVVLALGVSGGRSVPDDHYYSEALESGEPFDVTPTISYTPGLTLGAAYYDHDYFAYDLLRVHIPMQITAARCISPLGLFVELTVTNPFNLATQVVFSITGSDNPGAYPWVINLAAHASKSFCYWWALPDATYGHLTTVSVGADIGIAKRFCFDDPASSGLPDTDGPVDEWTEHSRLFGFAFNFRNPSGEAIKNYYPIGTDNPFSVVVSSVDSIPFPVVGSTTYYPVLGAWCVLRLDYEGLVGEETKEHTRYVQVIANLETLAPGDHSIKLSAIKRMGPWGNFVATHTESLSASTMESALIAVGEGQYPIWNIPTGGTIPLVASEVIEGPFITLDSSPVIDSVAGRSIRLPVSGASVMQPLAGLNTYEEIPEDELKFVVIGGPT